MDKVSVNALEKYVKDHTPEAAVYKLNTATGDPITYQVKPRLSLKECIEFVEDVVVEYVRAEDMMIIPVAKQFLINKNILTYYANFTMPQNESKAYDLVTGASGVVDEILKAIDTNQFNTIVSSINERIKFEQQKMIALQQSDVNEILVKVNQLMEQMSGVFNQVDGSQMAEFIAGMSKLSKASEITPNELASAISSSIASR